MGFAVGGRSLEVFRALGAGFGMGVLGWGVERDEGTLKEIRTRKRDKDTPKESKDTRKEIKDTPNEIKAR